jgi:hypothetical protein
MAPHHKPYILVSCLPWKDWVKNKKKRKEFSLGVNEMVKSGPSPPPLCPIKLSPMEDWGENRAIFPIFQTKL